MSFLPGMTPQSLHMMCRAFGCLPLLPVAAGHLTPEAGIHGEGAADDVGDEAKAKAKEDDGECNDLIWHIKIMHAFVTRRRTENSPPHR